VAPARPLADVDGVTLVLVSVELWTSGLHLRLAGLRSAVTDGLDAEFDGAMVAWAAGGGDGRERDVPGPPRQPGESMLRSPLSVSDDVGTRYRRSTGFAAGRARHGGRSGGSSPELRPMPPG
jgi:hypothetical protein